MSARGRGSGSGFGSFFSTGTADDADGEGANAGDKNRFSELWSDRRPLLDVPDLDGDDVNDGNGEAHLRVSELMSDNAQLRAQLDWSLQQLEKLKREVFVFIPWAFFASLQDNFIGAGIKHT